MHPSPSHPISLSPCLKAQRLGAFSKSKTQRDFAALFFFFRYSDVAPGIPDFDGAISRCDGVTFGFDHSVSRFDGVISRFDRITTRLDRNIQHSARRKMRERCAPNAASE